MHPLFRPSDEASDAPGGRPPVVFPACPACGKPFRVVVREQFTRPEVRFQIDAPCGHLAAIRAAL